MTTTPQAFQTQWPLALQALGVHAQIHNLRAPWSIDLRAPQIFVHLPRGTHEAWIASVEFDRLRAEERQPGGVEALRTEWDVRLPDTGFELTLVAYLPVPDRRMQAVPA